MLPATSPAIDSVSPSCWLTENGPAELEHLFRAVIYSPVAPIVIADNNGHYHEVNAGATKLLGLPREKLIGRKLDDFAGPAFKPQVSELWRAFLEKGEEEGKLQLAGPDGTLKTVEFTAKANILPVRHVLVLNDKSTLRDDPIPSWVQDYALFLLDPSGGIATWYSGAERIYGYSANEARGRNISMLYAANEAPERRPQEELKRAADEGHFGNEGWQVRKDGSRFWANVITMALRDEHHALQGFARIVRDFSDRHERDEKLRRSRARNRGISAQTAVVCVVSGEFDRVAEANDVFLDLVGYTRDDLAAGQINAATLNSPAWVALDDLAHEEALRFGACTPYEKEMIRKDGTPVPVLLAMAVLKLSPFRWIAFVQDLRERDRIEPVPEGKVEGNTDFEEMVGGSVALRRVMRQVELVAPTDATVLVLGETGTGKELVARAIHRISPRRNQPFVMLNCAAIPTGLLESELFGYERGAFTGALQQKIGRFEMAHRGTLFLDEVGDIPLELQPKLLRALQEKSFERLGGTRTIPIDVRLVAATNRNLTQMMEDKLFRSDLYYRLKVFPITAPPLRDRPDDIPILVRHFMSKYAAKMGRMIERISPDTMRALVAWHWPGNVRELENFIERSVILTSGNTLRAPLSEIREDVSTSTRSATLEHVEREYIIQVLRETKGVVTAAATKLGLHRTTLNAMMRKLGLSREDI